MQDLPGRIMQTAVAGNTPRATWSEVKMLDPNSFKRSVKDWMRDHPAGTEADLVDYCEELIPPSRFAASQWLVEQTLSWYRHILTHRELTRAPLDSHDDDADGAA